MQLVSLEFAAFFAVVAAAHWALPARLRNPWLVLASYAFYSFWDWRWTALLLGMSVASYRLAPLAAQPARRRLAVAAAVAIHAGTLLFFKLAALSDDSLGSLRGAPMGTMLLPLGLSYYTFQCLGYVLDVSRGAAPASGFGSYALFSGFFVQLTAGPIGRARALLPQIEGPRTFDAGRFADGLHLLLWGLFQKVFVADNLAPIVTTVFDAGAGDSGASALLAVYAFTLQLYGDFAGYSNMARGLGKLLGLDLAENFKLPFFAQDVQEHWKRWHVSLSEWFSDFVYRPIVDLPLGLWKFYAAPLATLLVMGLWHKLTPQMALLGLNYGFWIALTIYVKLKLLEREWEPSPRLAAALPWINRFVTLHLVCGSFILLRAHSVAQAGAIAAASLSPFSPSPQAIDMLRRLALYGTPLALAEAVEFRMGGAGSLGRMRPLARLSFHAALIYLLARWGRFGGERFFYSIF